jgi:hypothetical protein
MTSTPEKRPRPFLAAAFSCGLGLIFLYMGLSRPSIANMRTIDIMHLLVTGAFFGVALVWVVLHFRGHFKG